MSKIATVLYEYLQEVQSLVAPSIAATFFLGVFFKRISRIAGTVGLVVGFVIGMIRMTLVIFRDSFAPESLVGQFVAINWLHFCVFLFLFSIALIVTVSIFTKAPDEKEIQGLTFGSATPEQAAETRASWNKWDVIHTMIVLGVIAVFYISFW